LWLAIVGVLLPTLAAMAVRTGAAWGRLLSQRADALAGAVIAAIAWAAAIIVLGQAVGASPREDRRLLQLSDGEARRARYGLLWVALVTALGFLAARLIYLTGASIALTVALNAVQSLAYAAVAVMVLVSFGARPSALHGLVALLLSLAVTAIVIAVLAGYETLAALIAGQVFWLGLIAAVAWLAARLADDACQTLFHSGGVVRRALKVMFGLSDSAISQIGVLAAAGLQLLVVAGALILALTPFGQSGALLAANFGRLGSPIRIGQAKVSPAAIAAGLIALAAGLGIARLVRDWFDRRYLPVTSWDVGLRTSASTGVGYLSVLIAVVCALGVMGLGFQQIVLIASALSVGIGFGLQQIVQNFVSGVILLVERPVKVGDWVCVDQMEGDITRIRVRATELRMADRTTVLVPNSELITKPVQNRTRVGLGTRVELRLPIADPSQARRALEVILAAAAKDEGVRAEPAPQAFVEAIAVEGPTTLALIAHLADPAARSLGRGRLYLAAIEALGAAGIPLAGQGSKAS
jgi:small-conductance mechanosensitive channel